MKKVREGRRTAQSGLFSMKREELKCVFAGQTQKYYKLSGRQLLAVLQEEIKRAVTQDRPYIF